VRIAQEIISSVRQEGEEAPTAWPELPNGEKLTTLSGLVDQLPDSGRQSGLYGGGSSIIAISVMRLVDGVALRLARRQHSREGGAPMLDMLMVSSLRGVHRPESDAKLKAGMIR
jgi:hypothetical protein